METKDQRLEMRVTQQTLDSMDDIIASVNTPYKLSRSDLGRSFIEQGIERHYGRGPKDESSTSLIAKLSLYFQLAQQQRLQWLAEGRSVPPLGYEHKQCYHRTPPKITSTIAADTLVRQAYLQKLNWFFELDQKSLESIDTDLSRDDVMTLMSAQPSAEACAALEDVIAVTSMFRIIGGIVHETETKIAEYGYTDLIEKHARIKGYVEDKSLTLSFKGYPATEGWTLHAEMLAVLEWIHRGEANLPPRTLLKSASQDFTAQYAAMLQVFQEVSNGRYFNLDALLDMVKDRRL